MNKSKAKLLTKVKEYLEYRDGHLYWLKSKKGVTVGKTFGTVNTDGYIVGGFDGKLYYEHKLIWFYHYGYFPDELDHKDNNKSHNKLTNLREATSQQNKFNVSKTKGTSKYKGVCWDNKAGKWLSQYRYNGSNKFIGHYINEEDAAKAYDQAVREIQGTFHKENSYE